MLVDKNDNKMDYSKKETPVIHFSPKNKAINPDRLPKKKREEMPDFCNMSKDELMCQMVSSIFGIPIERDKYLSDNRYKAVADLMMSTGFIAMATLLLREMNFPIEKYIEENKQRFNLYMQKHSILRI